VSEDAPPPDDVRWEYKDITVPLNLREGLTDKRIRPLVDRLIAERLDEEGGQGWQPDEPVDLSSLRARDRIQFRFRWFSGPTYVSATIRLKRPTR
jgi:hypothetical protein